jgi:aspartate/glutamate racemase
MSKSIEATVPVFDAMQVLVDAAVDFARSDEDVPQSASAVS